jgi:hypothetical protein
MGGHPQRSSEEVPSLCPGVGQDPVGLHDLLIKSQARRAERERKLPFAQKLRILDRLMAAGRPTVEEV